MKVAVVIPTLNEEHLLPATLARTASLGFDELVIVDGGSVDRTTDIVTSYRSVAAPPCPISLLTSPTGRARQMNAGAAASVGDVLVFLHADSQLPDDARRVIANALDDSLCVGGRFDVRFEVDTRLSRLIARMMNLRSRLSGIASGDHAIFVRRAVFDRLGGFADIPIMEDIEFTSRLRGAGRLAALRSVAVTSYRRWSTHGAIRTIVLMWTLRFLYWIGASPHTLSRWYRAVR